MGMRYYSKARGSVMGGTTEKPRKIVRYEIFKVGPDECSMADRHMLIEGWQPYGSPMVVECAYGAYGGMREFFQAMVIYEGDE